MFSYHGVVRIITGIALVTAIIVGSCTYAKLTSQEKTRSSGTSQSLTGEMGSGLSVNLASLTYEERIGVIKEHCSPPEGLYSAGWLVNLETNGTRAPIESIHGSEALEVAAAYYSMFTLDFDVSLNDIISTGFWPFAIDESIDKNSKLYDFQVRRAIAVGDDFSLMNMFDVGSDAWLIECKIDILATLYRDYYFHNGMVDPAPELGLDIVPSFWYNPFEDRPMESSDKEGDICLVPINNYWNPGDPSRLGYSFEVLQINFPSSRYTDSMKKDILITSTPAKTTSSRQCCLYRYERGDSEFGQHYSVECCCPCNPDRDYCCTFSWTAEGESMKSKWVWVKCVNCDFNPPYSYCVREYGMRAPDTVYAIINGNVSGINADCDPTDIKCCYTDQECINERDNFWANLNAEGSRVMTWRGPTCTKCGGSDSTSQASAGSCCKPKKK